MDSSTKKFTFPAVIDGYKPGRKEETFRVPLARVGGVQEAIAAARREFGLKSDAEAFREMVDWTHTAKDADKRLLDYLLLLMQHNVGASRSGRVQRLISHAQFFLTFEEHSDPQEHILELVLHLESVIPSEVVEADLLASKLGDALLENEEPPTPSIN